MTCDHDWLKFSGISSQCNKCHAGTVPWTESSQPPASEIVEAIADAEIQ